MNDKYISCRNSVCQACSFQAGEEDSGYNEEEKSLGWCSSDCRGVKKSKKRNLNESESEVLLVEKNKK